MMTPSSSPTMVNDRLIATLCKLEMRLEEPRRAHRAAEDCGDTLDAALLFSASTGESMRAGRRSRYRRTCLSKVFLPRPPHHLPVANRRRQATRPPCHKHEPWWACACSSRARLRQRVAFVGRTEVSP